MDFWGASEPADLTSEDHPGEWKSAYGALHWIQFAMATLSIIGASSIIAYAIFQRSVRSPEVRPLFYLCLTDLILGFCWLVGVSLYGRTHTNHSVACYNLQTAGQIFYMSSFMYTTNYTWHLYVALKDKIHGSESTRSSIGSRLGIVLSSLVPVILMVPVFSVGNVNSCYRNYSELHSHRCLLLHNVVPGNASNATDPAPSKPACAGIFFYGLGAFLTMFSASGTIILALVCKACAEYRGWWRAAGHSDDQKSIVIRVAQRRAVLYPLAFFCCWGPAFCLGLAKLFVYDDHSMFYIVLYTLQAFTAPSQGLLNCLVYGWTQNYYHYLKRRACCDAETQTPLLRKQKRQYESTKTTVCKADAAAFTSIGEPLVGQQEHSA